MFVRMQSPIMSNLVLFEALLRNHSARHFFFYYLAVVYEPKIKREPYLESKIVMVEEVQRTGYKDQIRTRNGPKNETLIKLDNQSF